MVTAQIGLLTSAAEVLATAVGSGMLLGSFGGGTFGLLARRSRRRLEERVLTDGYYGGILALAFAIADAIVRYGS